MQASVQLSGLLNPGVGLKISIVSVKPWHQQEKGQQFQDQPSRSWASSVKYNVCNPKHPSVILNNGPGLPQVVEWDFDSGIAQLGTCSPELPCR
jgi:hypothetical protein